MEKKQFVFIRLIKDMENVDKKWIKEFLEAGTKNGCGDLSIMIGTVSKIIDQVDYPDEQEIRARKSIHRCKKCKNIWSAMDMCSCAMDEIKI